MSAVGSGSAARAVDPPPEWEADVALSDGGTVHLRPIRPDDADALQAMHGRLSDQTRYLRFFGAYPTIPARDLERFTVVDHLHRVAIIATLGEDVRLEPRDAPRPRRAREVLE